MRFKFFTQSELENYYDESFDNISPTDLPLDKFMVGHSTINCPECGNIIDITCRGTSQNNTSIDGYVEIAYCDTCDIEYKRERCIVDEVNDNINYQFLVNRTDKREDYLCKYCHNHHVFTIPNGEFEKLKPTISSYESVTIPCECGEVLDINNITFPDSKICDCGREYQFSINENN